MGGASGSAKGRAAGVGKARGERRHGDLGQEGREGLRVGAGQRATSAEGSGGGRSPEPPSRFRLDRLEIQWCSAKKGSLRGRGFLIYIFF